jgi:hypothetical protein
MASSAFPTKNTVGAGAHAIFIRIPCAQIYGNISHSAAVLFVLARPPVFANENKIISSPCTRRRKKRNLSIRRYDTGKGVVVYVVGFSRGPMPAAGPPERGVGLQNCFFLFKLILFFYFFAIFIFSSMYFFFILY